MCLSIVWSKKIKPLGPHQFWSYIFYLRHGTGNFAVTSLLCLPSPFPSPWLSCLKPFSSRPIVLTVTLPAFQTKSSRNWREAWSLCWLLTMRRWEERLSQEAHIVRKCLSCLDGSLLCVACLCLRNRIDTSRSWPLCWDTTGRWRRWQLSHKVTALLLYLLFSCVLIALQ